MRSLWLSLSAVLLLAGCACGAKKSDGAKPELTPTPQQTPGQGQVPSNPEPKQPMSRSRAAGLGFGAKFMK